MQHDPWKKRQEESLESIGSGSQENTRQHKGDRRRCFADRIRQPGVKWKHWNSYRESDKKSEERPHRIVKWNGLCCFVESRNVKRENAGNRVVMDVNKQDAKQHQRRAQLRVQNEFHRRMGSA